MSLKIRLQVIREKDRINKEIVLINISKKHERW